MPDIYDEDIIQTSADYSRAGKTIEVEVDLYNDYSNLINSVKERKVTEREENQTLQKMNIVKKRIFHY